MAISSADISGLPDYTDAELLKLYRWAMANGAAGQTRSINGRMVAFPAVEQIRKTIEWLEQRTSDEGNGGNIALITFVEPS